MKLEDLLHLVSPWSRLKRLDVLRSAIEILESSTLFQRGDCLLPSDHLSEWIDNEMATNRPSLYRRPPFTAKRCSLLTFLAASSLFTSPQSSFSVHSELAWLEWTVKQSVNVTVSIERAHTNVSRNEIWYSHIDGGQSWSRTFCFECLVISLATSYTWLHRISQETVNVYNNLHTYNSVELYNSYFCKPVYLYYILYLMSCAPGKQLPNVATCQITVAGPGTYT